jgi:hypothetical protein
MNHSDIFNYADDNTISAHSESIPELLKILETESEVAINWFKSNDMIVNPDKFQAIILNKHGKLEQNIYELSFDNKVIESSNSVRLLGIDIDDKLFTVIFMI